MAPLALFHSPSRTLTNRMSHPISLEPIFEAKLAHHDHTQAGRQDPSSIVVRTPIYNLEDTKKIFWSKWKPSETFRAERVIDIQHKFPEYVLKRVSSDIRQLQPLPSQLLANLPEHAWFFHSSTGKTPRETPVTELDNGNKELRQYCEA
jgi:hypothetical protein